MVNQSRLVLTGMSLLIAAGSLAAQDIAAGEADYIGGRGLITLDGVSGMFLNPTSGTLPEGALTTQYCVSILRQNDDEEIQHTAMVSYGVTDWLEVGAFGRISDLDNADHYVGGGGPLVRVRLLRDEGWLPELSLGAFSRNGYETLEKHTLFAAQFMNSDIGPEEMERIRRVVMAAVRDGKAEALVYTFPSALCTDHGRAINNGDPAWPQTLQGQARKFFERWEAVGRPNGYRLTAMIISFPHDLPGDVGFFLSWAPDQF